MGATGSEEVGGDQSLRNNGIRSKEGVGRGQRVGRAMVETLRALHLLAVVPRLSLVLEQVSSMYARMLCDKYARNHEDSDKTSPSIDEKG